MVSQSQAHFICCLPLHTHLRFPPSPSECTLRDYSNHIQTRTGFQNEVIEQLQKEVKIQALSDAKKDVSLLVDEMKVKESLVYDKLSGKIVGFVIIDKEP